MTRFVQTDNTYYYGDKRGVVVNCDNCSGPSIWTQNDNLTPRLSFLYEVIETPVEYSCELLGKNDLFNMLGFFGGIVGIPSCDDNLIDNTINSRTKNCKNDYCVPDGGYQIKEARWWGNNSKYPDNGYISQYYMVLQKTGSFTFTNIPNISLWCSNNYHKMFDYNYALNVPFNPDIDYDFEIITETFEIDMELYRPGYQCVSSFDDTSNKFFGPLIRPDFQYRNVSCYTPDIPCEDLQSSFFDNNDPLKNNQGACSKVKQENWQDENSFVNRIEKVYIYEDCGSKIPSNSSDAKQPYIATSYYYDFTRNGEYCELCTPSGVCFPSGSELYNKSWPYASFYNTDVYYDRNTLTNTINGLNPQCCSRTNAYYPNMDYNLHINTNSIRGMRSPFCGSGIREEYECISPYKTLKCIDGDVKSFQSPTEVPGVCGSNECSVDILANVPQDKKIDVTKINYKIKQNKTVEHTLTTVNKTQKRSVSEPCPPLPYFINFGYIDYTQGCTQLGFQNGPGGDQDILTYKTKYVAPKILGDYKITVTFAYCKGTPKPC